MVKQQEKDVLKWIVMPFPLRFNRIDFLKQN